MAHLMGSYRTATAGYDAANTRLVDESGMGNHLPLLAGAPDFTGSYSSQLAFKMHGTAYFGGPNILHPEVWTAILVIHPLVMAGETLNMVWATGRNYAATEHGHATAAQPFEESSATNAQIQAHRVQIGETSGLAGNALDQASTSTGLTTGAWNVMTAVWNGETSQTRVRFGTSAWTTDAITQHYQIGMQEEWRLGYRPTGLTVASNHLGVLRCDIYAGDYTVDDPTAYAARIAALIATPNL